MFFYLDGLKSVQQPAETTGDARDKAWHLVYASLHPHVLDFDYDPMITLTGAAIPYLRICEEGLVNLKNGATVGLFAN